MEMQTFNTADLIQLRNNVELIKNILIARDEEGELTDWARKELQEARSELDENLTSSDNLRQEIVNGL